MPTRKIAAPKRDLSETDIKRYAEEYLKLRRATEEMTKTVEGMKATLVKYVAAHGYNDDRGSEYVDIGIPGCSQIKRERRVSKRFDEDKATAWLEKKGLYDECTTTIVALDEDKVLALGYEKKIPEKVLSGFYSDSETMAFKVIP